MLTFKTRFPPVANVDMWKHFPEWKDPWKISLSSDLIKARRLKREIPHGTPFEKSALHKWNENKNILTFTSPHLLKMECTTFFTNSSVQILLILNWDYPDIAMHCLLLETRGENYWLIVFIWKVKVIWLKNYSNANWVNQSCISCKSEINSTTLEKWKWRGQQWFESFRGGNKKLFGWIPTPPLA